MTFEYSPQWEVVLLIIGILFIALAIFFAVKIAYSEELPCLIYSDGKLAVIEVEICVGSNETISWFLNHGYQISGSVSGAYTQDRIYMTR